MRVRFRHPHWICIFHDSKVQWLHRIPKIGKEVDYRELNDIFDNYENVVDHVFIEKVHALFGSSAQNTFNFGYICGILEAMVVANGFAYTMIQPKAWQKVMWEGITEQRKKPKKLTKKELKAKEAGEKVRTPKKIGAIDTKKTKQETTYKIYFI